MDTEQLKEIQRVRDEARRVLKETAYSEYKLKDKINKRQRYNDDPAYREHVKEVVKRYKAKKRAERQPEIEARKEAKRQERLALMEKKKALTLEIKEIKETAPQPPPPVVEPILSVPPIVAAGFMTAAVGGFGGISVNW